ncbi:MAG: hypothetical protein AMJ68_06170 [Acidithiobacillales bacterium SG8_45]|jgi:preprotein translocase subunit SecG|nr:MAG: hypothetical protein AMJ68_06170 [Acidithiobacillales bacterium SG8_45]
MRDILIAVLIVDSLSLIGLILLQRGKGADAGAAFGGGGGGASDTLFGSRGSATFLSRLTAVLAVVFFLTTMALAYYSAKRETPKSAAESVVEQTAPKKEAPAVPGTAKQQEKVPDVPK